ncbi:jg17994, partial [Pararge aegeria aegeria]
MKYCSQMWGGSAKYQLEALDPVDRRARRIIGKRSIMTWYLCLILTSLVNLSFCINRPVFKIVLTQKGFAQFLQYDVETPPVREFTFCTWLRVFDLSHDQSVFTYV